MIAFIVRFEIKTEAEQEFVEVAQGLAEQVRANEPGNHLYQLCRDAEKPGHYVMLERYENEEAFQIHTKSPYFREVGPRLAKMLAVPMSMHRLEELPAPA